jgi:hypothetical protein
LNKNITASPLTSNLSCPSSPVLPFFPTFQSENPVFLWLHRRRLLTLSCWRVLIFTRFYGIFAGFRRVCKTRFSSKKQVFGATTRLFLGFGSKTWFICPQPTFFPMEAIGGSSCQTGSYHQILRGHAEPRHGSSPRAPSVSRSAPQRPGGLEIRWSDGDVLIKCGPF